ncbi:heme oxygenase-like protein, partial [Dendrothele bispora CBS 962.96]
SQSYTSATRHPFLHAAGNGTLSNDLLSLWLSQDRIYAAHAYPKFIGSLIANIPFSSSDLNHPSSTSATPESPEVINQRILQSLVSCLTNVIREAKFFQETSEKWGLKLEGWQERKGTRDYTAEMTRISANGRIEDGLVFLWAMEKVYLDAWTYVRDQLNARDKSDLKNTDSAVVPFAHNWSSPEFIQFVEELADLVDNVARSRGIASSDRDSEAYQRAEEICKRVVELEIGFWPEFGEEKNLRS